jgi:hypothetical protein
VRHRAVLRLLPADRLFHPARRPALDRGQVTLGAGGQIHDALVAGQVVNTGLEPVGPLLEDRDGRLQLVQIVGHRTPPRTSTGPGSRGSATHLTERVFASSTPLSEMRSRESDSMIITQGYDSHRRL